MEDGFADHPVVMTVFTGFVGVESIVVGLKHSLDGWRWRLLRIFTGDTEHIMLDGTWRGHILDQLICEEGWELERLSTDDVHLQSICKRIVVGID